ncbi:uncharacterized acetyltransferase At3g50280-like [Rutidosis leptorrhynchoides]|uniref:uncharacterized acetyltransferase At3g50280-like n=1 Tax=Rutidosis leptorrhynchoides TaxID=125765 RepID=UPI003A99150D
MTSPSVNLISECLVKPLHDLSPDANKPIIYFTPFELAYLNVNYSQKGLLFAKPSPSENPRFSITDFLDKLQHTLSSTLTHFYPLAARLATRKQQSPPSSVIYIDPKNSPGVKFVYAKADANLSDVLNAVEVPLLFHSFFDLNDAINHDGHTLPLLSIQVTELTNGIFIGGSVNHLVADGTSFWHFMATWSEIFKSKDQDGCFISRPPVIKQRVHEGSDPIASIPYTREDQFIDRFKHRTQVKERFFHFSSGSVSRLKEKANIESNMNDISSLQAVSALIWRCVTRARRQGRNSETVCRLLVNNRRKMDPPLPDDYFGNVIGTVMEKVTVEDLLTHDLGWAALKLHEMVKNYDNESVKKWVGSWLENPVVYKMSGQMFSNVVHFGSSPRFDMYGCEFGLGKAVAARSGFVNKGDGKMTLYPGREGGGSMDVEVCLLPECMMDLECDEEFMSALKS